MWSKILIALAATAIGMSSCDWLASKSGAVANYDLKGKWKVDSMSKSKDSSEHSGWLAMASADATVFEFTDNEIVKNVGKLQQDRALYERVKSQLKIKSNKDSTEQIFAFNPASDSSFSLSSTDSSTLYFSKSR